MTNAHKTPAARIAALALAGAFTAIAAIPASAMDVHNPGKDEATWISTADSADQNRDAESTTRNATNFAAPKAVTEFGRPSHDDR